MRTKVGKFVVLTVIRDILIQLFILRSPMKKAIKNQVNNPKPNQDLVKIYFKSHGASIVVMKNLQPYDAAQRRDALKRLYSDWCGEFIITK